MVELQELSRRIGAEIDTRFAKLEAAMRDADRRIAVLNRLSGMAGDVGKDVAERNRGDRRHAVIYELADAGFSSVDIARDLGKTPGEVELILNLRKEPANKQLGDPAIPPAKNLDVAQVLTPREPGTPATRDQT
jgi:hypothetical protein